MLTVGDRFPSFRLKSVRSTELNFEEVTDQTYAGKWKVYFFWPKDFTFICPTEITAFSDLDAEFKKLDTVVIGASTDSDFVHLAWRRSREDLGSITQPWLSDIKKELATALGIVDHKEGVALRATFIVDNNDNIRFASVNDLGVGRNPQEVLRVLTALQTGELCPCNWSPGKATIKVS